MQYLRAIQENGTQKRRPDVISAAHTWGELIDRDGSQDYSYQIWNTTPCPCTGCELKQQCMTNATACGRYARYVYNAGCKDSRLAKIALDEPPSEWIYDLCSR